MKINFCNLDNKYSNYNDAEIVIIPIPFDATSTWIKGARYGPDAILSSSKHIELYDLETDTEVYKNGIYTDSAIVENSNIQLLVQKIEERILLHLKNKKFTIIVGGNHTVSIGAFKAFSKIYDELTIIQLDAHADLRDIYHGSKLNHACVMARAKELCSIVQVGIRSISKIETKKYDVDRTFFAHDIKETRHWYAEVSKKIEGKIYITIDVDVFDPSIMPSTGTPEPDGLNFKEVTNFIEYLAQYHSIVGFDVVELCPNKTNISPDFMVAKLIYKALSYCYK